MGRMVFGSDGLLYGYNSITKLMEGYDVTDGSLDDSFSFSGKEQEFATDGTLIFIHNPLTNQCEGYDPTDGSLDENFDVDWSDNTPIVVRQYTVGLDDFTEILGYNALTKEVVGYDLSDGSEVIRFSPDFNPMEVNV